jgi:DNA-binding MarR family transcriptional regulator
MIAVRDVRKADAEFDIFETLRKIIRAVDIYSTRLREQYGLNSSQLSCLLVLGEHGYISLSKMSQLVSLSPGMITGIIDQLENKGLVSRVRNSPDRRVITIELTKKGKSVLKKAPPSFQKKLMESLSELGGKEKRIINRSLATLLSRIVEDVLIDSSLLRTEEKLAGIRPAILSSKSKK